MTIEDRARHLAETGLYNGAYVAVAPPHQWWDWYAAYMDARDNGATPEQASEAAGKYMEEVEHIVVTLA